jgi:DNA-binding CsgD family transcriptional regulator
MNYNEDSERIFQKVKKFFKDLYNDSNEEIDYEQYIEQLKIVETITKHRGGTVILFDRKNLRIIHITGNASGNNKEDVKKIQYFFHALTKDHKTFPLIAAKWVVEVLSKLSDEERKSLYVNYCGVHLIHPVSNQNLRWNIASMNLNNGSVKNSPLVLIVINNIAHLLKGNGYWFRASSDSGKVFSYFSEDGQSYEEDIISVREKEILQYIFQGMNTKEIAKLLQISPNTVDNHRRNMLARTGAKDTTALIQLCQMNGVL